MFADEKSSKYYSLESETKSVQIRYLKGKHHSYTTGKQEMDVILMQNLVSTHLSDIV